MPDQPSNLLQRLTSSENCEVSSDCGVSTSFVILIAVAEFSSISRPPAALAESTRNSMQNSHSIYFQDSAGSEKSHMTAHVNGMTHGIAAAAFD